MTDSLLWLKALNSVQAKTTLEQFSAFRSVLDRAQVSCWIRTPAPDVDDDGGPLRASWSFAYLPARAFTLDIHRDGSVEWFYRDGSAGVARGTEEPVPAVPDEASALLSAAFGLP